MAKIYSFRQSVVLATILLLGLVLRVAPWGQNRFLEDEALYAHWGLQIATGADPMLDEEPVDKPPLHVYTLALSSLFLGCRAPHLSSSDCWRLNETAARLPSLFASCIGITMAYALGQALFRDRRIGLLAALLLTLSPFDILFASTGFTDPLMTALVLGALWAAARGRLGTAGLLVALAGATKQQGLLFLPLIVVVAAIRPQFPANRGLHREPAKDSVKQAPPSKSGWLRQWERVSRAAAWFKGIRARPWVRFALGFAIVVGGVLWWDLAREQRPGFFEQSLISYGGLGPARPEALGERAVEWLRLVGDFWISPWFNGLVICALVGWLVGGLAGLWPRWSRIDVVLGGFAACYLALHWLVGFQVWDRYLLALVPLFALLSARAVIALLRSIQPTRWQRACASGLGLALVLMLASPVLQATKSELPMGGDHGAYDGIDELAAYMGTRARPGSVLYHYWLGYHYRFYLYGAPLRLHWYPDLEDLSHDAYIYRREPRYIAFPSWRDGSPAVEALAEAGMNLLPVLETTRRDGSVSFQLYRLEGP